VPVPSAFVGLPQVEEIPLPTVGPPSWLVMPFAYEMSAAVPAYSLKVEMIWPSELFSVRAD
jgi:hypothetical protein